MVGYPTDHWASDPNPASGLAKYLTTHEGLYNRVKNSLILSMLPQDMKGLKVLDYGCGCGLFSIACAKRGAMVTGIDASGYAIASAKLYASREGVPNRCNFVVSTEGQGSEYDLVLAKDVIEHMQDDLRFVRTVGDMLKPNGQFVVSTQNAWSLNYVLEGAYERFWCGNRSWMGWDPTHIRFYSPMSLKKVVAVGGLTIERWASMYIVPYDILSWLFLLRKSVTLSSLRFVDYLLGKIFPFNRVGWAIIASCRKLPVPILT